MPLTTPTSDDLMTAPSRPTNRDLEGLVAALGYIALAVSLLLTVILDGRSWNHRGLVVGLTVPTAVWTVFFVGFPANRIDTLTQRALRIYLAGVLVMAAVLMSMAPLYFVYAITGFFHGYYLKPLRAAFMAVFATSLVVNSLILNIPNTTTEGAVFYAVVVAVQTIGIGFGIVSEKRFGELAAAREVMVSELEAALAEKASLESQVVALAREGGVREERQRIAREIHDTVAQGLAGIITQLEAAHRSIADVDAQRRIDDAMALARESLSEARRSVEAVLPGALEGRRLVDALEEFTTTWTSRTGITVTLTVTGTIEPLHPEVEVSLLRAAQEALANAAKHSAATRAGVTLSYMDDVVTLDVRDDGTGFDPDAVTAGTTTQVGLEAMRQRIERLAGRLNIESEPGTGTAVSVTLPAVSRVTLDG